MGELPMPGDGLVGLLLLMDANLSCSELLKPPSGISSLHYGSLMLLDQAGLSAHLLTPLSTHPPIHPSTTTFFI